jgi:hypothetical protein
MPLPTAGFAALTAAPGVTAHSGPYPVAGASAPVHGETAKVMAEGTYDPPVFRSSSTSGITRVVWR